MPEMHSANITHKFVAPGAWTDWTSSPKRATHLTWGKNGTLLTGSIPAWASTQFQVIIPGRLPPHGFQAALSFALPRASRSIWWDRGGLGAPGFDQAVAERHVRYGVAVDLVRERMNSRLALTAP